MPTYIASNSFGKDSIATILLALEHNEPLDRSFTVEVMFDNSRGISGEIPEHIQWVYDVAKPKLERMGVVVDIVKSRHDYVGSFYHVRKRGKNEGKIQGFPLARNCWLLRNCKLLEIDGYLRQFKNPIQYVGIAFDEQKRLARLQKVQKSLLAKYHITEKKALEMCKSEGLLSPIYEMKTRGGVLVLP